MRKGTGSLVVGIVIWVAGILFSIALAAWVNGDIRDWHNTDFGAATRQANYVGAQTVIWTGLLSFLPFAIAGACFVLPGMNARSHA